MVRFDDRGVIVNDKNISALALRVHFVNGQTVTFPDSAGVNIIHDDEGWKAEQINENEVYLYARNVLFFEVLRHSSVEDMAR